MSMYDDQPVCLPTCRCGYWDPCPGRPWYEFRELWHYVGREMQRRLEHELAGEPPTRWQRLRRWLGFSDIPRAVAKIAGL